MKLPKDKQEYLRSLAHYLRKLPKEEQENAISFYDEFFSDAGVENYGEVAQKLGAPRDVALIILQEKACDAIDSLPPSPKRGISATKAIILGVFAAPVAVPFSAVAVAVLLLLAGALLLLFFSIAMALFFMLLSLAILVIAGGAAGIAYVILGFVIAFTNVPTGLMILGGGVFMLGLGALSAAALYYLIRFSVKGVKIMFGQWVPRIFRAILGKRRKRAYV